MPSPPETHLALKALTAGGQVALVVAWLWLVIRIEMRMRAADKVRAWGEG